MPGPGQYRPEVSIDFLDNKKSEIMPISAVFAKNKRSERNLYNNVQDVSPAVGTYDPIYKTDIGKANPARRMKYNQTSTALSRKQSMGSFGQSSP